MLAGGDPYTNALMAVLAALRFRAIGNV